MSPADRLKDGVLHVSKWFGLFRLSRYLTRRGIRILCYHGFAVADEVAFRPSLFITPGTFDRRLAALSKQSYPIVSLETGLRALDSGSIEPGMTVITIDDIFHSVLSEAVPILQRHQATATVYVTSYYCTNDAPVFRLMVRYMFWKTRQSMIDLAALDGALHGKVDLTSREGRSRAEEAVIAIGEALDGESQRGALADRLAVLLDVDLQPVRARRMFHIVTPGQVEALTHAGMDVQLHTHRHRLPLDRSQVARELEDNRKVLEPIAGKPLLHFCYPSGVWSPKLWPWLRTAGIVSATTCDSGLNYPKTPRLGLKRILDAEDVSQIGFEAEMAGFKDVLRQLRARLRQLTGTLTSGRNRERAL